MPIDARAERMRAVAARLRQDAERFARRMADEMGKPLAEGRADWPMGEGPWGPP